MTRSFAGKVARVLALFSLQLHDFAVSNRYPTRTVEHAFAWVIIVWGYSVIAHVPMLSARIPGNVYEPMLNIMPALAWGWCGLLIGLLRIVALIGNGHWRPSPELRLVGAAWGLMFWLALSYCYYIAIVVNGGPDFPMRRAFYVLILFEAYSCYRCGQDIGKRQKDDTSGPRGSVDAGYG